MRSVQTSVLVVIHCFLIGACSGGGGGGGITPEAQSSVGPGGGFVAVTDPQSPLFGVSIEIPAGALAQDAMVTISRTRPLANVPTEEIESLVFVEIGPTGTAFSLPATLSLPYDDANDDGYVDDTLQKASWLIATTARSAGSPWEVIESAVHDPLNERLLVEVQHLSLFGLRFTPQLRESPIVVFVGPDSAFMSATENMVARTTITEAVSNGPWQAHLNCLGWSATIVPTTTDADVVIQWGPIPERPTGLARTCAPDFVCVGRGPFPFWEITLNEALLPLHPNAASNPGWNLDEGVAPGNGEFDLYSAVAHELAHALGLPRSHLETSSEWPVNELCIAEAYDPGSICAKELLIQTEQDQITPFDAAFFVNAYPVSIRNMQPTGSVPSSRIDLSFEVVSTCSSTRLDPATFRVFLVDSDDNRLALDVGADTQLAPDGKSGVVSLSMLGPLASGLVDVRVIAGDTCNPPRVGGAQWEFTVGPPQADFMAAPSSGLAPLQVSFSDRSSGEVTSRLWRFGDRATSTDVDPVHTYAAAGTYTVSLTITGPTGTDTETKQAFISVTGQSGCITVREGPWEFDLSFNGNVILSFVKGELTQSGCNLSYDRDRVFNAPLVGNRWSDDVEQVGFSFTGTFSGSPATRFAGTWTDGQASGPFTGRFVGP